MSALVLLLRGVNVGGHGKLPMADLRGILIDLGAGAARTYIQSGNAVVAQPVDTKALADKIEAQHGFRPGVFALSAGDWAAILATNPFPNADPKTVHAFFHSRDTRPDMAALHSKAAANERLAAVDGAIWLHAPDGIGRSKLAGRAEKLAGLELTARNARTLAAIDALLQGVTE